MRGVSLRLKINLAILLAFLVAAVVFGAVLRLNMANRLTLAHDRARVLLASVAAHRLEALIPLLTTPRGLDGVQEILARLLRVDGIEEATLFRPDGTLLAQTGSGLAAPLVSGEIGAMPTARVFTVSSGQGRLLATLIEPVPGQGGLLGFLRLRYSLESVRDLNRHLWEIFTLALICSYVLMAGLLNFLLHCFVLRPVDTLRQALEDVAAGSLDTTVPVRSRDALGRLAKAFNAMSTRLRETSSCLGASRAEVEEHQRLLETRVRTRTAELAEANDKLVREIEARRRAEDCLRQALAQRDALLGNTQVGLATDRARIIADINPRGAAILGYDRAEMLGRSVAMLFPEKAEFEAVARDIESRLSTQEPISLERRLLRRDGTLVWTRLHGKLVDGGEPGSASERTVVWAFDDITREKERQGQLEQARQVAEAASRAKGSFLAVMSHEIRTPLNVITGLAELLLDRDATEEQRGFLRTINDSACHLLGVLNDILDFSKIEAGKLVLDRVNFCVQDLLDAVIRVTEAQARQQGLAFAVAVATDVPPVLLGDPGRLRQVLLNLLGNAVKFTEKGTVGLEVFRAEPQAPAANRIGLGIRISDTGIGIASDRLPELFASFQQGSDSIARRYGGTGLGLAISKEIVERMGGRIEVSSRPEAGCVFSFTVFMAPGDPAKATALRESATAPLRPSPPALRLRILLVEDNALNAAVIRLHLERLGHDLTVASSARDAYALLARHRFNLVLMDIEMPDIDGITATRTIRAGGPQGAPVLDAVVPIMAVTAHAIEDVRSQCLEAGMNGFVTKPVNYHALESILADVGRRMPLAPPPAPPTATSALFDPEGAREAMGISWDQYVELSHVSFREGCSRLDEASQALDSGDIDRAVIAVHTFKGAAATLGAYSCRDQAVTLEQAVRAGRIEAAQDHLAGLQAVWATVRQVRDAWQAPQEVQKP
jgi:PAS domain S-box-containing protein